MEPLDLSATRCQQTAVEPTDKATDFWRSSEWLNLKAKTDDFMASQFSSSMSPPTIVPSTLPIQPDTNFPESRESRLTNAALVAPQISTILQDTPQGQPIGRILPEAREQLHASLGAATSSSRKRKRCTCPNCIDRQQQTGKTSHRCIECGKVFSKTNHLTAHLRAHRNEKPFRCQYAPCTRAFTRSDDLKRHERIHTGEKLFECDLCAKRFTRSDHLNKHRKVHQRELAKTHPRIADLLHVYTCVNAMKDLHTC